MTDILTTTAIAYAELIVSQRLAREEARANLHALCARRLNKLSSSKEAYTLWEACPKQSELRATAKAHWEQLVELEMANLHSREDVLKFLRTTRFPDGSEQAKACVIVRLMQCSTSIQEVRQAARLSPCALGRFASSRKANRETSKRR